MRIDLKIEGIDQIIQRYGQQAADQAIARGLEEASSLAADGVKRRAPVQTGFLRSSIQTDVEGNTSARTYASKQGSRVYYAMFVEKGTGVHGPMGTRITPRSARALAWVPKGATGRPSGSGGKIVRPSVSGQPGQEMFAKTVAEDKQRIVSGFQKVFWQHFT